MNKFEKIAACASILGLVIGGVGFINANAETRISNDNRHNSGTVFNQPAGPITIDNRVVTKNLSRTVSTHDGSGAILMSRPDFTAFISHKKHAYHIDRLLNGTELEVMSCEDFPASDRLDLAIPWCRVKVVEGKLSATTGWLPSKNITKL